MISKKRIWKRAISGVLSLSVLFCGGTYTYVYAQEEEYYDDSSSDGSYEESAEEATVAADTHTDSYYQAADTDSITGWPAGPNIEGESAILVDLVTDTVLYSKNADTREYPASITKILTCLMACENLDMNASFAMSQSAAYGIEAGSSTIYADTGEIFTNEQATMALMLESANEMALALGEEICGSTKKFVEFMNKRARELGCTNTHFNNPNGLPDELHYTTANDMAKIARAAWYNPLFRTFVTTTSYQIPPTNVQSETRYLTNHHKMMTGGSHAYDGVLGGKTGYTVAAGNTLVTYAKRGSMVLMTVVLNSINGAYDDTAALLDYGFNNFEYQKVVDKNASNSAEELNANTLPYRKYVLNSEEAEKGLLYYRRNYYVTVPIGAGISSITTTRTVEDNAVGPTRVRTDYFYNDHQVGWAIQYEQENLLANLIN